MSENVPLWGVQVVPQTSLTLVPKTKLKVTFLRWDMNSHLFLLVLEGD